MNKAFVWSDTSPWWWWGECLASSWVGVGGWEGEGHISSGLKKRKKKKRPDNGVKPRGKDEHKQDDNMATADTNTI